MAFISPPPTLLDRAKGCLLCGAIGDSLGAAVEFHILGVIKAKYGENGIQEFDRAYGMLGGITDDTQMTLFTAEGLIRAKVRLALRGVCHPPSVVAYAYQRWLHTQGESCDRNAIDSDSLGWLVNIDALHHRRAPGNTCLSALRVWNQDLAKNDSKGCGSVMRSAPFGFCEASWELAWESAAITHGHIEAKASAAIFAETIRLLVDGQQLEAALIQACALDRDDTRSARLVRRAIDLASGDVDSESAIRELGEGWVADEALGIAAYCALKGGSDFEEVVRLAVNHDGDSDSTGAIAGNLVGAQYGVGVIPTRWLEQIELRDVVEQVATDLVMELPLAPCDGATEAQKHAEKAFLDRYPGG
jgi:ADP-ribosylglycohydrolase